MWVLSMLLCSMFVRCVVRVLVFGVVYMDNVCWFMCSILMQVEYVVMCEMFFFRKCCRLVMLVVCYWVKRWCRLLQFFSYNDVGVILKKLIRLIFIVVGLLMLLDVDCMNCFMEDRKYFVNFVSVLVLCNIVYSVGFIWKDYFQVDDFD